MFKGETDKRNEEPLPEKRRLAAAEANDTRKMDLVVIVRADKTAETTADAQQADELIRGWVRRSTVSLLLGGQIDGWIKADPETLTEIIAETEKADTWRREEEKTEMGEVGGRQLKAPAVLWVRRAEDGSAEYLRGAGAENLDNLVTTAQLLEQLRRVKASANEKNVWSLKPVKLREITEKIFGEK
jgi:hypothetical protein